MTKQREAARLEREAITRLCLIKPVTTGVATASSLRQILENGAEHMNYSARGRGSWGVYILKPKNHRLGAAGGAVPACEYFFLPAARLSTVSEQGAPRRGWRYRQVGVTKATRSHIVPGELETLLVPSVFLTLLYSLSLLSLCIWFYQCLWCSTKFIWWNIIPIVIVFRGRGFRE